MIDSDDTIFLISFYIIAFLTGLATMKGFCG